MGVGLFWQPSMICYYLNMLSVCIRKINSLCLSLFHQYKVRDCSMVRERQLYCDWTTVVEPWSNSASFTMVQGYTVINGTWLSHGCRGTPVLLNLDKSPEVDKWLSKSGSRINNHLFILHALCHCVGKHNGHKVWTEHDSVQCGDGCRQLRASKNTWEGSLLVVRRQEGEGLMRKSATCAALIQSAKDGARPWSMWLTGNLMSAGMDNEGREGVGLPPLCPRVCNVVMLRCCLSGFSAMWTNMFTVNKVGKT